MSAESSSKIPSADQVHEGELSHLPSVQSTLNGLGSHAHGTEQPPKHIGLRPHALPPSPRMAPPPDRDSTRVFIMESGRAGIVFARGIDGKRPPQKLCASLAHAEALVRDYKLGKPFIAFVGWLANMLPRNAPSSSGQRAAQSGIRSKLGETMRAIRRTGR